MSRLRHALPALLVVVLVVASLAFAVAATAHGQSITIGRPKGWLPTVAIVLVLAGWISFVALAAYRAGERAVRRRLAEAARSAFRTPIPTIRRHPGPPPKDAA